VASGARAIPNTDFLGMQSEVTRFHIAMLANDDVKQDHPGIFTVDPIDRIDEWRPAMLADPSHTTKCSKDDAIAIRRTVPFRKRKYCKFERTHVLVVQ